MERVNELVTLPVKALKPYQKNARKHGEKDIAAIVASIEAFGFRDPIGVWGPQNIVVEGHGRLEAAKILGMTEVPCIRLDDLTDEQRRAYGIAHNSTAELSSWDAEILPLEVEELPGYDMTDFGVNMNRMADDWIRNRERNDDTRQEGNEEYNEFLDKFEPKKTTDDCYTPDPVYDAVADWVAKEYGLKKANFVRPFYPGGDYQKEKYRKSDIVVDNPPFSILSGILRWYHENGIRFFLFGPTLTLFSSSSSTCCAIPTAASVVYENGAVVNTSFLTNLEPEDLRVRTAPDLQKAVQEASDVLRAQQTKELPKYSYPDEVITAAMVARWSKYGIDFRLRTSESMLIEDLDSMKDSGKQIFGRGYLLSERAAAERAAAERAAATRWPLSERESPRPKTLSRRYG